jgi:hypothetical protein
MCKPIGRWVKPACGSATGEEKVVKDNLARSVVVGPGKESMQDGQVKRE